MPPPGTETETQACALPGNGSSSLSVHKTAPNPLSNSGHFKQPCQMLSPTRLSPLAPTTPQSSFGVALTPPAGATVFSGPPDSPRTDTVRLAVMWHSESPGVGGQDGLGQGCPAHSGASLPLSVLLSVPRKWAGKGKSDLFLSTRTFCFEQTPRAHHPKGQQPLQPPEEEALL